MESSKRIAFESQGYALFPKTFDPSETLIWASNIRDYEDSPDIWNERFGQFPWLDALPVHPNVLAAVRECIGPDIWYLQVGGLQKNHNRVNWHRDCTTRRFGVGGDWKNPPYGVVKALIYLHAEEASLMVVPQSHRRNLKPSASETVIRVSSGDVLVFDERLLHCGRSFSGGRTFKTFRGHKIVFQACFGMQNIHARRFFSYFRYVRKQYAPLRKECKQVLQDLDLLVPQTNLFEEFPEEHKGLALPGHPHFAY